ncbi:MAG TPA: Trm112 family protein [Longimicrobiales bacterium]|nr:Trm112 family protein [Longimicrobiales bacterium]
MHLLLTDRLACPRCGPGFGLIVLAHRLEDRRVLEGVLGCSNCRDAFPIANGFADLRAPPRGPLPGGRAGPPGPVDESETERLVALVGVPEGPGTVALIGGTARHAAGYAGRVPDVEVVAVDEDLASWPESTRVSRLAARPGLPIFDLTLRGVVVDGDLGPRWVREAARTVARLGRVVVVRAPTGTEGALVEAGLRILAAADGTVVAARG